MGKANETKNRQTGQTKQRDGEKRFPVYTRHKEGEQPPTASGGSFGGREVNRKGAGSAVRSCDH